MCKGLTDYFQGPSSLYDFYFGIFQDRYFSEGQDSRLPLGRSAMIKNRGTPLQNVSCVHFFCLSTYLSDELHIDLAVSLPI